MADWIIDRSGKPVLILDEYCFRSPSGDVTSWLFGNGVYALNGDHVGWYEDSTLYDLRNHAAGTLRAAIGTPGVATPSLPPMPLFSRRPHIPLLKVRHMRPLRDAQPSATDNLPPYWQAAPVPGMNAAHPY